MRGEITSLAVHDGKLFAGGRVRLADTGATTFFGPVAAWDGVSWSRAGPDEFEDVHDVEVIGDSLYAAGGGRLVRLAEGAWELITPTTVNTIAAIGSSFVLGGAFQSIDDLPAARVAIRQGDTWDTLGYPVTNEFGGSISALKEIGGQLIAGGRFTSVGELPATGLARWDGLAWTPFGEMLQPSWIEFVSVKAIAEYEGDLIIGGSFVAPVELGTTPNIARWDGTQWHAIGDGLGTFTSLGVAALAVYRGDLYAVGDFAGSGDVIASGIARWNGSTWSRVVSAGSTGTGLSGFGVNALVVAHESLYIGGHGLGFAPPMAFGPQLTSIFRWDGTSYRFVPSSPSSVAGTISVLCTMGDDVIAGGSFTSIHGVPANSVARWDGSAWHPLGSGVLGAVYAAAEYNGSLIVAGSFDSAGGVTAENIASWDGNTWHPLGSGLTDGAFAIAMFNGELIVGGAFAGTGGLNSAYRARWSDGGVPWIASQPTDTTTCIDGIALLATASAAGYDGDDGLIFQWRHNGGLIADGPAGASPSGGEVSGAHLPTLVITGARLSDAGVYDCAISNSCGEVISAGATLTVLVGPCPWDLNTDGTVGVGDLGVLIGAWGAVAPPAPIALDLDESGTIDLADIAQVLTRWGALCE